MTDTKPEGDPLHEIGAMQKIAEALKDLDDSARSRVLRWAAERYKLSKVASESSPTNGAATDRKFNDLAELYAACDPSSDADKALVAGYWIQFGEGRADFNAQEINTILKNLGHGVANITSAFDTLKERKPSCVIQLKKAGTAKQARKTYRVTVAGKGAVELMLGAGTS